MFVKFDSTQQVNEKHQTKFSLPCLLHRRVSLPTRPAVGTASGGEARLFVCFAPRPPCEHSNFKINFSRAAHTAARLYFCDTHYERVGMNFHQSHKHTSVRQPLFKLENLEDRRLLSVPFLGTPFTINQQIQAENFDSGGEGAAYHDTTPGNTGGALRLLEGVDIAATTDTGGGFSVVDTAPGEWMAYTVNVPTAGQYYVETRLASASSGGSFHYEWNGLNVSGGIPIPNTGSTSTYLTLKTGPISLSAGVNTLRLVLNNAGSASLGSFNWIRLTPYSTTSTGGGGTTGGGTTGGGTTGGGTTGGGTTVTNGLKGVYYNNMDFTGSSVTRIDKQIAFNWDQISPCNGIDHITYSVRWTGKIQAQKSERYTFYANADDGIRVWVNNQLLIDSWKVQVPTDFSGSINLVAGQKYDIKIEYFQRYDRARMFLGWSSATTPKQLVPSSALFTG